MQTLLQNKAELFKAAHKITKFVLGYNKGADYQITFGQVLKAMFAFNIESKGFELKRKLHYNSRFGQKSELEITNEVMTSSLKFDVESAMNHVLKSTPQAQAQAVQQSAYYYYADKGVTMC